MFLIFKIIITEFNKLLEEICNRLSKKDITIISAFDKNEAVSHPAAWLNNSYFIGSGNSYSAAYITAQLCQWMENEEYLKAGQIGTEPSSEFTKTIGNRRCVCTDVPGTVGAVLRNCFKFWA